MKKIYFLVIAALWIGTIPFTHAATFELTHGDKESFTTPLFTLDGKDIQAQVTIRYTEIGKLYQRLKSTGWSDVEIAHVRTRIGEVQYKALKIEETIKKLKEEGKLK